MCDAAVAVCAEHLCDDHLVAAEPASLVLLGLDVRRVTHESLQRLHRLPVVHIGDKAGLVVLPGFLAEVAWNGFGDLSDDAVQGVELVVVLALGEGERRGVHACEMGAPNAQVNRRRSAKRGGHHHGPSKSRSDGPWWRPR
jgi:hypothetical protein